VSIDPTYPPGNFTKKFELPQDIGASPRGIGDTISSFTEQLRGADPIVNKPIHIRVVRKSGPVMTLIDLPGITHHDSEVRRQASGLSSFISSCLFALFT
jgi:hypothetical protein